MALVVDGIKALSLGTVEVRVRVRGSKDQIITRIQQMMFSGILCYGP